MSRDYPEPTPFNGQDDRPMSSGSSHGPTRKDLRATLYAAVRIYGLPAVQACLDDISRQWLRAKS